MANFRPKARVWLYALVLIAASIAGLFVLVHFEEHLDPLFIETTKLLLHGVLAVGIVSILMELRDFRAYVSDVLQEHLRDQRYLRTLDREELRRLKRNVDERLLGAAGLDEPGSFYEFVGQQFEESMKTSYRTEMIDSSVFTYEPSDPTKLLKTTTTQYWFIKGSSSEKKPMVVRLGCSDLICDDALRSIRLRAVRKEDGLDCSFEWKFQAGDWKGQARHVPLQPLPASVEQSPATDGSWWGRKKRPDAGGATMRFSGLGTKREFAIEYEIPGSADFDPSAAVWVELVEESIVNADDDQYWVFTTYPAKSLFVSCVFPEGYTTRAQLFGFQGLIRDRSPKSGNSITATIPGWCLPGHGVSVHWRRGGAPLQSRGAPNLLAPTDDAHTRPPSRGGFVGPS